MSTLLDKTTAALNVSESDFYRAYNEALEEDELFEYVKNQREYVYLPDYYYAEQYISDRIKVLSEFSSPRISTSMQ